MIQLLEFSSLQTDFYWVREDSQNEIFTKVSCWLNKIQSTGRIEWKDTESIQGLVNVDIIPNISDLCWLSKIIFDEVKPSILKGLAYSTPLRIYHKVRLISELGEAISFNVKISWKYRHWLHMSLSLEILVYSKKMVGIGRWVAIEDKW